MNSLFMVTFCLLYTSSAETGYSPVTTDTAATIVPCYAKGYTVKYLPHHVRLVDIHDPQKESSSTFHFELVPKGIKPVGIPSDYTVIETPVEHVMCCLLYTSTFLLGIVTGADGIDIVSLPKLEIFLHQFFGNGKNYSEPHDGAVRMQVVLHSRIVESP